MAEIKPIGTEDFPPTQTPPKPADMPTPPPPAPPKPPTPPSPKP